MTSPTLPAVIFLTFLGTASFLIEYGETRILMDPGDFFTNRLTVEKAKTLEDITLILLTHTDFDHMNRLASVPHSRSIPILAPAGAAHKLCGYNLLPADDYTINGIQIKKFKSVHGTRHGTPHTGFLIFIGSKVLCNMGDAYRLAEPLAIEPDYLFLTLSGLQTNVKSGLANVSILNPKTVIPMHWEFLCRTDGPGGEAGKFQKALAEKFPAVACLIPPWDEALALPAGGGE